ncbi:MAG TPA: endolytic transglycosylase MltG, partial [Phnomibacter sp.]|nr:endolytic transglycosylase MltG [Phnomibacter sp.]
PTVRFAMKDFKSNRVLYSHLRTPSPYNTYMNRGLPPGPICTPSAATIDSVLNAPETDYLFFVANADLRGGSTFTTNLTDHGRAARLYQDSLRVWLQRKAIREKEKKDSLEKAAKEVRT